MFEFDRMLDVLYLFIDGFLVFVKVKFILVGFFCVREFFGNIFFVNLVVFGMVVLIDFIFGGINFIVIFVNYIINKMLIKKKIFCK